MSKFTIEDLRDIAYRGSYDDLERELALQLLASMEQDPVLYVAEETLAYAKMGELHLKCLSQPMGDAAIPLYAAPQLPQPEPEEIAMQNFRSAMEGIGHIRRTLEETFGGMHGTHCEPDVLVECKEICDAIYEAYRKTAPVTQDGWVACSERMPDVGDVVLTAKDGFVNVGEMERSGANYRYFTSIASGRELPATHWQPLPAAPQQEVKSALEMGMSRYGDAMQGLAKREVK